MKQRTRTSILQLAQVMGLIFGMFGAMAVLRNFRVGPLLFGVSFTLTCLGYLCIHHAYRVLRGPLVYQAATPFFTYLFAFTFLFALFR